MTTTKLPRDIRLVAYLTSGLTLVVSLIYIVLCAVVLLLGNNCDIANPATTTGSNIFINTLYNVYFKDDSCSNTIQIDNITGRNVILILVSVSLVFSFICMIASYILLTITSIESISQYIFIATYIYVGVWLCSLVVDITFATYIGMDYSHITEVVNEQEHYVIIRLGIMFLLCLTLKGFFIHIINAVLLILLLVFISQHRKQKQTNVHPIHTLGALDAYDWKQNKSINQWQRSIDQTASTGPRTDHGLYENSPRRSYGRQLSEYSNNRSFHRSDSWHHSKPGPGTSSSLQQQSQEANRYASSPSPTLDSRWDRDWPPPPVPAPDYSPTPARRLKSALKPAYG